MSTLREDAKYIYTRAIEAVLPDEAVRRALDGADFPGRVILVAAGKAAWRMASAAVSALGERIDTGIVITKYGHAQGTIPGIVCREAGHPVPDENSFSAARSFFSPEGAARFLKARSFRARNCRTSPRSFSPAARTSWRSTRSANASRR